MFLNSISHFVCKFQKDWMKNKNKNSNFGDGPLKPAAEQHSSVAYESLRP